MSGFPRPRREPRAGITLGCCPPEPSPAAAPPARGHRSLPARCSPFRGSGSRVGTGAVEPRVRSRPAGPERGGRKASAAWGREEGEPEPLRALSMLLSPGACSAHPLGLGGTLLPSLEPAGPQPRHPEDATDTKLQENSKFCLNTNTRGPRGPSLTPTARGDNARGSVEKLHSDCGRSPAGATAGAAAASSPQTRLLECCLRV